MDNLTHSLAGAVLGQMGLKTKTGLALPTLIIAANLPDIDAFATIYGVESLAMRRGLTHGPIALLILPLLLTGIMLAWDRWRPNPERHAVRPGWLLLLAYVGTWSHPALDWMNNYGIRFLEPYSSRWFYGDTLFIIDVWVWAALILGVWISLRREKRGDSAWRFPAVAAFGAICLYVLGNGLITDRAEAQAHAAIEARNGTPPTLVVASPMPVTFWRREMLWRDALHYGRGDFALAAGVTLDPDIAAHNAGDPRVAAVAAQDPAIRAYLFWSRMPVIRFENGRLIVNDQRFGNPLVSDRFRIDADLP
jgi:inner membrane protein